MSDKFTTLCGRLDELNGVGPEDGVVSSRIIAQVWHDLELVAECASHDWAEKIAEALNDHLARRDAQLAEATRQRDELVEAVYASDEAHHAYQHAQATGVDPEVVDNALFDNMAQASLRLSALAARIRDAQPKGEPPKKTRVLFACKDTRGGEEHFFPEIFRGNAGKAPDYIEVAGVRYEPPYELKENRDEQ